jgi:cation diffusion facilitator family transporter
VTSRRHHGSGHEREHREPRTSGPRRTWTAAVQPLGHVLRPHNHGAADIIDDAWVASRTGIRAVQVSFAVLAATAVLQLIVTAMSGSVALLADTVHNLGDALTAVPLWIAFAVARRAASAGYPYGYGRAEDLAGVFVVVMIALSAAFAGVESVRRLLDPQPVAHVGWVAAAGLIGFAGNELVAVYRTRVGRRIGSAALVADGLHARADGLTSLAVVVGAVGTAAGLPLADPLVGLVITAVILAMLKTASREVWRRLMDGVDPDLVATAKRALADHPGIIDVDRVRMRWVGHRLVADAAIRVPAQLTVGEGHDLAHVARDTMIAVVPRLHDATVHVAPAAPTSFAAASGEADR